MRKIIGIAVFILLAGVLAVSPASAMGHLWGWYGAERSPAVAALLSLMPMPLALGQFYVGDWGAGLLFTFLETAGLATAMTVALLESPDIMHDWVPLTQWDVTGKVVFFSALGGFVLIKFVDAFTAGLSAESLNRRLREARVSLILGERGVGMAFALRY